MPQIVQTKDLSKELIAAELNVLGEGVYELFREGQPNMVLEVLRVDYLEKSMLIRTNHRTYDLVFKDELDLVLDKMGIKRVQESASSSVKAPMPGKVLDVIAKEGDKLSKGDNILILEAMKMENVIKAETDCTIRKILIGVLDNVDKNQVLVELDFEA